MILGEIEGRELVGRRGECGEEKQLSSPKALSPHGRAASQPILVWLSPPSHPVLHSNKRYCKQWSVMVLWLIFHHHNRNYWIIQLISDLTVNFVRDGLRASVLQLSILQSDVYSAQLQVFSLMSFVYSSGPCHWRSELPDPLPAL